MINTLFRGKYFYIYLQIVDDKLIHYLEVRLNCIHAQIFHVRCETLVQPQIGPPAHGDLGMRHSDMIIKLDLYLCRN